MSIKDQSVKSCETLIHDLYCEKVFFTTKLKIFINLKRQIKTETTSLAGHNQGFPNTSATY